MAVIEYQNSCTWFIHDTESNKFLLQLRDNKYIPYPNMWGFPGGTKEGNEPPRETSYRELQEELDYRPSTMEEVLTIYHHNHSIAEHFYYIPLDVPADSLSLREGQAGKYFLLEEIESMPELTWWTKEVLPILRRHISELRR
jgi:8-oxo-dGTP pyrophosphatase MutT (NUDIX family)